MVQSVLFQGRFYTVKLQNYENFGIPIALKDMLNFPISSPKVLLNIMGCLCITVMYLRLYKLYLLTNNRSPFKIMSLSTSNSITPLLNPSESQEILSIRVNLQLVFESLQLKTLKTRDQTPNWYSKGKLWFQKQRLFLW